MTKPMVKMECALCRKWVTRVDDLRMTCKLCTAPSPSWAVGADKVRFDTFDELVGIWREVMADTCEQWHDERDDYKGAHGHNHPKRPVDCFCWDFDAFLLMTDDELAKRGMAGKHYRQFQRMMRNALRQYHQLETEAELFNWLSIGARYQNKRLELANMSPRRRQAS